MEALKRQKQLSRTKKYQKLRKKSKTGKNNIFRIFFARINRAPHEGAALFPCLGSCAGVIFLYGFVFYYDVIKMLFMFYSCFCLLLFCFFMYVVCFCSPLDAKWRLSEGGLSSQVLNKYMNLRKNEHASGSTRSAKNGVSDRSSEPPSRALEVRITVV